MAAVESGYLVPGVPEIQAWLPRMHCSDVGWLMTTGGRVLVACEFSGTVRDAFIEAGHDAVSCDLLPTESPGPHIEGDVLDVLDRGWDLMVAHPPCTYLANSGVRWLYERDLRWQKLIEGAAFFRKLLNAPIPYVAVENPVMHKWARKIVGRGPDQTIQPWQFGHGETKAICLWLKRLPPLRPTKVVHGREARVHRMAPGEDRSKERSRFYEGVARAMADQWGGCTEAGCLASATATDAESVA